MTRWYSLDPRWACGAVKVVDGQVADGGALIFRRFIGQPFDDLVARGNYQAVELEQEAGDTIPRRRHTC